MNIFYLSNNQQLCAEYHVDKHVVKMTVEVAQILSSAHRFLDGQESVVINNNRKSKVWKLDSELDTVLYKATHINHPSTVWARQSASNYDWLRGLFESLLTEYTYRYGKQHMTGRLVNYLRKLPRNISDKPFTEPTPAMPDEFKVVGDSIQSYHNYYNGSKQRMFAWKNREVPYFIVSE